MSESPVLLVEDNPDDEELTRRAFRKSRLSNELIVAHDGQEALDLLLGTGETEGLGMTVQIVLLDLKLPKIPGLEVLRRIRADPRTKRLPVVILTSSDEERDRIAGYDLGANSYIRKPVDFTQFAAAVQQLSLYWLVLNEPPPPAAA